jgi:hypothetical protein
VNWDEPLEGEEDAASDDDDLEEGEAFDYRVDGLPAFSVNGADILQLPHGLKVVPTPWNGDATQDGARIAMRFRRGPKGLISNSKLVKWSDGSFTLQVGNEVFPVIQVTHLFLVFIVSVNVAVPFRILWTGIIGSASPKTQSTFCCSRSFVNASGPPP